MARTYLTIKCPFCGQVFDQLTWRGIGKPKRYGIPFKRCRRCGKDFVDDDVTELATKPLSYYHIRSVRFNVCRVLFWLLLILWFVGVPMLHKLVTADTVLAVAIFGIAVISVVAIVRDANNDSMPFCDLKLAYADSKTRLEKHPQYAAEVYALMEKR